jgi:integrase
LTNVHVRIEGSTVCTVDDKGKKHFHWDTDNKAYREKNNIPLIEGGGLTELRRKYRLTEEQVISDLNKCDKDIENKYFKLRAKTVFCLAYIWGKRRGELALIELNDVLITEEKLQINFTLLKKRKKGLFQYIDFLLNKIKKGEITRLEFEAKTQGQLIAEWQQWRLTDEGVRIKTKKALHGIKQTSKKAIFIPPIIEYFNFIKNLHLTDDEGKEVLCRYLFPEGRESFTSDSLTGYIYNPDNHLNSKHLLKIAQDIDSNFWIHLARKRRGSDVAIKYGRTIESIEHVRSALDLERKDTALSYIEESVVKMEDED